jgi:Caspase domain
MRCRRNFSVAVIVIAAFAGVWIAPATAKNRALLIAASEYADPRHVLKAPSNDAALMWQALQRRGFKARNIRVLTDSVPADAAGLKPVGRATKAAILAELERMVKSAAAGDTIFLFFSGHGSQQPDNDSAEKKEADGLDEIFLPVDIGRWDDAAKTVKNALLDDEVGGYVRRMRAAGAFVWLVFDSCHSGTMTRSLQSDGQDERTHAVAPQSLGVPQARLDAARAGGRSRTRGLVSVVEDSAPIALQDQSGVVAFFAAQSGEVTYETIFPRDYDAENRRPQSLLSYFLAQALVTEPNASYRRIAQLIRAGYDVMRARAPTPLFEGDLDRRALGSAQSTATTWQVQKSKDGRLSIPAGELNGLKPGAEIVLYDAKKKLSEPPVLRAVAEKVGIAQSTLRISSAAPKRLPRRMLAKLIKLDPAPPILIGLPVEKDLATRQVETALRGGENSAVKIKIVAPSDPADLYLRTAEGYVWILRSPTDPIGKYGKQLAKISLDDDGMRTSLHALIASAARARNLLATAKQYGGGPVAGRLTTTASILRANLRGKSLKKKCDATPAQVPAASTPVDLVNIPDLRHCDTLYLTLGNTGKYPIDLTMLYIGADGAILPFSEYGKGVRIEPGTKGLTIPLRITTWNWVTGRPDTVGLERMMMIGVERGASADLSFIVGFGHLATGTKPRTRSLKRLEPSADAFSGVLESTAGASAQTRSIAAGAAPRSAGAIHVIRWRTRDD